MMIRLAELGYDVDPEVFGIDHAEVWEGPRPRDAYAAIYARQRARA
jgi:hypothetical protein